MLTGMTWEGSIFPWYGHPTIQLTYPLNLIFSDCARFVILEILSKLSFMVQLVFFFVNASDAAVKTATSSTPASICQIDW